jgi:hypothetical protein
MNAKKYFIIVTILICGCFSVPRDEFVAGNSPQRAARGQNLVQGFAACGQCHGVAPLPDSPLSGGAVFHDVYGPVYAANLTPSISGIGNWGFTEFLESIRQLKRPDGTMLSSEYHQGIRWMADDDLLDIFTYLQTLQPVKMK